MTFLEIFVALLVLGALALILLAVLAALGVFDDDAEKEEESKIGTENGNVLKLPVADSLSRSDIVSLNSDGQVVKGFQRAVVNSLPTTNFGANQNLVSVPTRNARHVTGMGSNNVLVAALRFDSFTGIYDIMGWFGTVKADSSFVPGDPFVLHSIGAVSVVYSFSVQHVSGSIAVLQFNYQDLLLVNRSSIVGMSVSATGALSTGATTFALVSSPDTIIVDSTHVATMTETQIHLWSITANDAAPPTFSLEDSLAFVDVGGIDLLPRLARIKDNAFVVFRTVLVGVQQFATISVSAGTLSVAQLQAWPYVTNATSPNNGLVVRAGPNTNSPILVLAYLDTSNDVAFVENEYDVPSLTITSFGAPQAAPTLSDLGGIFQVGSRALLFGPDAANPSRMLAIELPSLSSLSLPFDGLLVSSGSTSDGRFVFVSNELLVVGRFSNDIPTLVSASKGAFPLGIVEQIVGGDAFVRVQGIHVIGSNVNNDSGAIFEPGDTLFARPDGSFVALDTVSPPPLTPQGELESPFFRFGTALSFREIIVHFK